MNFSHKVYFFCVYRNSIFFYMQTSFWGAPGMRQILGFIFCLTYFSTTAQPVLVPDFKKCYQGNSYDWLTYSDIGTITSASRLLLLPDSALIVSTNSGSNAGFFDNNIGVDDAWVFKLTPMGDPLWKRNFGSDNQDFVNRVLPLVNGGFLYVGYSESPTGFFEFDPTSGTNAFVLEADSGGNVVKKKIIDFASDDKFLDAAATADGGLIMAGLGFKPDTTGGAWIVKMDSNLNVQWSKRTFSQLSVINQNAEYFTRILPLTNGTGYLCGGICATSGPSTYDYLIAKFSTTGDLLWKKIRGGPNRDVLGDMLELGDGTVLMAGFTGGAGGDISQYKGGNRDIWLTCLGDTGQIVWEKTIGGSGSEMGIGLARAKDGHILLAGRTNSTDGDMAGTTAHGGFDALLLMLDSLGNIKRRLRGGSPGDEVWTAIAVNPVSGNLVLGGGTGTQSDAEWIPCSSPTRDAWLVKVLVGDSLSTGTLPVYETETFSVYPQPAGDKVTVEWSGYQPGDRATLYNSIGAKVQEEALLSSRHELSLQRLPKGLYRIRVVKRMKGVVKE